MSNPILELRDHLAELVDLRNAAGLLSWDQQTMMPPRGAPTRAESLATLERISHEQFISAQTGRLIEAAASHLNGAPPDSDDASLVRVVRRHWEKARRVPTELAADIARAASLGQEVWAQAREQSDYASFAPYLARNYELAQRYVDCFDEFDCAYDALLDDYEPGMKSADVARLFDELKSELVPVIAKVTAKGLDAPLMTGDYPVDAQREMVAGVIELMGFDSRGWRLDDAVHPFATSFGSADVRITTRWDPEFLPTSLFGAMHECGHGLYEAGIAESLQRTPLGHAESLGLHESQSRLWENMVGRGRAFSGVLSPRINAAFGTGFDEPSLYRAVNRIEPSYIRVEADEVTYALHIVLRFELEQELIEGRLGVDELPEIWNARFKESFGLEVPDDAAGCAPGRPLVGGTDRLLPHLRARQPDCRPPMGEGAQRRARARSADRRRRAVATARVAARERPPPRREVHRARTARPDRRRATRGRSLREVPEDEAQRRLRRRALTV